MANPFSLNFLGIRLPGSLGELEDQLYKDAENLQDQIKLDDQSRERRQAESLDRQRTTKDLQDRTRRLIDAQTKVRDLTKKLAEAEAAHAPEARLKSLSAQVDQAQAELHEAERALPPDARLKIFSAQVKEARARLADAEKRGLPEAELKSLAAQLDAFQQRYELAAAQPSGTVDPGSTFKAEPQVRLEQIRDLEGKISKLQKQLDQLPANPKDEQGKIRREQMQGLLESYKMQLQDLHRPAPQEAARPAVRTAQSPAVQLEASAVKLREQIAQAKLEGNEGQVKDLQKQLDGLLKQVQTAATQIPKGLETRKPDGTLPTRGESEIRRREGEIAMLETQIALAEKDPKQAYKVERLQTQLSALQDGLEAFKTQKATDPGFDMPVATYDAQKEAEALQIALDELGTGYDLLSDPKRLDEASRLRTRLAQVQSAIDRAKALPPGSQVRVDSPYGAGGVHEPRAVDGVNQPAITANGVVQDPKVKELLDRYYGDNEDFQGFQIPPETIEHPEQRQEVTTKLAPELTEEIAAEFLPFLPEDTDLPDSERQRLNDLQQSANNELTQAWNKLSRENGGKAPDPQKVFDLARESFERNMLGSEDGAFAVLRDVRTLMNQARSEGTISQKQYDKYEQFLNNTFTKDLIEQIKKDTGTGVRFDKEDVVQDLFKTALKYADQQIKKEQKAQFGGDSLQRLLGLRGSVGSKLDPWSGKS